METKGKILEICNFMKEAMKRAAFYKKHKIPCEWFLASCSYSKDKDQSKVVYVVVAKNDLNDEDILRVYQVQQKYASKFDLTPQKDFS